MGILPFYNYACVLLKKKQPKGTIITFYSHYLQSSSLHNRLPYTVCSFDTLWGGNNSPKQKCTKHTHYWLLSAHILPFKRNEMDEINKKRL